MPERKEGTVRIRITQYVQGKEHGVIEYFVPPPPEGKNFSFIEIRNFLGGDEVEEHSLPLQVAICDRKGQIAYADARRRMRQEGVRLHSNNLRSEIGKRVEELNKIDPRLNITFEEALEFTRELVQEAVDETFKTNDPIIEKDGPLYDSVRSTLKTK